MPQDGFAAIIAHFLSAQELPISPGSSLKKPSSPSSTNPHAEQTRPRSSSEPDDLHVTFSERKGDRVSPPREFKRSDRLVQHDEARPQSAAEVNRAISQGTADAATPTHRRPVVDRRSTMPAASVVRFLDVPSSAAKRGNSKPISIARATDVASTASATPIASAERVSSKSARVRMVPKLDRASTYQATALLDSEERPRIKTLAEFKDIGTASIPGKIGLGLPAIDPKDRVVVCEINKVFLRIGTSSNCVGEVTPFPWSFQFLLREKKGSSIVLVSTIPFTTYRTIDARQIRTLIKQKRLGYFVMTEVPAVCAVARVGTFSLLERRSVYSGHDHFKFVLLSTLPPDRLLRRLFTDPNVLIVDGDSKRLARYGKVLTSVMGIRHTLKKDPAEAMQLLKEDDYEYLKKLQLIVVDRDARSPTCYYSGTSLIREIRLVETFGSVPVILAHSSYPFMNPDLDGHLPIPTTDDMMYAQVLYGLVLYYNRQQLSSILLG